jgi:hypothetical protein
MKLKAKNVCTKIDIDIEDQVEIVNMFKENFDEIQTIGSSFEVDLNEYKHVLDRAREVLIEIDEEETILQGKLKKNKSLISKCEQKTKIVQENLISLRESEGLLID